MPEKKTFFFLNTGSHYAALVGFPAQKEGYPGTQEPRNHSALRGGLQSRGVAALREGYSQLSCGVQEPHFCSISSFPLFFATLLFPMRESYQIS